MLTSPDVSDKFKFSPTLLSYVLPPLASFLAAPEIFCLFNYDLRCFNSSSIFVHVAFPIHVVVETNSSRLKSPAQYWSILVFLGCICNIDFSVRQQDTRLSRDCHVFCFERMIFWWSSWSSFFGDVFRKVLTQADQAHVSRKSKRLTRESVMRCLTRCYLMRETVENLNKLKGMVSRTK